LKRIIVAPLDWGLGHATRCIPLIKLLLSQNCRVLLAGQGKVKYLLQKEFPEIDFLELPGYNVRYSKRRWTLPFTIAVQIPKILSAIKTEQRWLQKTVEEHSIDTVISDNRFGLHHAHLPCVFLTHQLCIETGWGKIANAFLQQLNYRYINRFAACWVPDAAGEINLGGQLSHPSILPAIPMKYIGLLSRFAASAVEKASHVLILLSGPEPQRTVLENRVLGELKSYSDKVILVRGLPGNADTVNVAENVTVYNHLPAEDLQQKIAEASFVIARCGYSTVMDLAVLKKKSILIPTPGQTEQEYLARHLLKMNFALCIEQKKFSLKNTLELAASFNYRFQNFDNTTALNEIVAAFVRPLQNEKTSCVQ